MEEADEKLKQLTLEKDESEEIKDDSVKTKSDKDGRKAQLFRMWDSMRLMYEADIVHEETDPSSSSSSSSSSSGGPVQRATNISLSKSVGAPVNDLVVLEDQLLTMWDESKKEKKEGDEDEEDEDADSMRSDISSVFDQIMNVETLIQTQLLPPDHDVPSNRMGEYWSAALEELNNPSLTLDQPILVNDSIDHTTTEESTSSSSSSSTIVSDSPATSS